MLQDLFEDPVMAADGATYSRAAIVGWLRGHDLSPMTRASLKGKDLYPHIEKRSRLGWTPERHQAAMCLKAWCNDFVSIY